MPDEPPNVLFLLSDEHSFRYQSRLDPDAAGEPVSTPALDGLAETGTTFERTYCQVPICSPSRMSILTGNYAVDCGVYNNGDVLQAETRTLPETLGENGYETCLVGKMHFSGDRQYAGFDHRPYGDHTGGANSHQADPPTPGRERGLSDMRSRTADAGVTRIPESLHQERNVARETISFVREQEHRSPDDPWFACASFSRPHFPLTAPRRYFDRYWPDGVTEPKVGDEGDSASHPMIEAVQDTFQADEIDEEELLRARAAYFAAVDYLDEVVGDMLGTLRDDGLLENTVVVYASDHGELAGEHGHWWKHSWFESSVRVPWHVQLPGHRDGTLDPASVSTPVSLLDLYPTLCGLVGAEAPPDLDGVDLSDAVLDGSEPDRGPVICDNFSRLWGDDLIYRMVVDGDYKYVQFSDAPELLFDVGEDPDEVTNLAAADGDEHGDVLERLRATVDASIDFDAVVDQRAEDAAFSEERSLGVPHGSGNIYELPDGRLVDAGDVLYRPTVIAEDPSTVFADWPRTDDE